MPLTTKEITVPLNDIRHLFIEPDCDPFTDRNLTISGLDYVIKQLRGKPLPEKIRLNLLLSKGSSELDAANVQDALRRHCLNIVKDQEEEAVYLNWQIQKNFKRALIPILLASLIVGSIMYHMLEERSRFLQILFILLNNCIIIIGWVLLWIPAEKFLYEAPRVKREIALYKLLANAEIQLR